MKIHRPENSTEISTRTASLLFALQREWMLYWPIKQLGRRCASRRGIVAGIVAIVGKSEMKRYNLRWPLGGYDIGAMCSRGYVFVSLYYTCAIAYCGSTNFSNKFSLEFRIESISLLLILNYTKNSHINNKLLPLTSIQLVNKLQNVWTPRKQLYLHENWFAKDLRIVKWRCNVKMLRSEVQRGHSREVKVREGTWICMKIGAPLVYADHFKHSYLTILDSNLCYLHVKTHVIWSKSIL